MNTDKKTVNINGQDLTTDEALKVLNDNDTIVSIMSVSIDNPNKKENEPLTNKGFVIDQDLIVHMCDALERFDAEAVKVSFKESSKIMGKTLYIIMCDPGGETDTMLSKKAE